MLHKHHLIAIVQCLLSILAQQRCHARNQQFIILFDTITSRSNISLTPEMFGAKGNGITDDSKAFQTMLDGAKKKGGKIILSAKTYKITSPLKFDLGTYSIEGNGSTLDFSTLNSGNAITIAGSMVPSYDQVVNTVKGVILKSSGRSKKVTGILFESPTHTAAANIALYDCSINGFGTGIKFSNRSYIVSIFHTNIYDCNVCVEVAENSLDAGENNRFFSCSLFNSNLAVLHNRDANTRFIGCSMDYNARQIEINAGQVYLSNCHIEGHNYATAPFQINNGNGSILTITDSNIAVTTTQGGIIPDYFAYISKKDGSYRHCEIINTAIAGVATKTGDFAGGDGLFTISGTKVYWQHQLPPRTNKLNNILANGDFENENMDIDNIFISQPPINLNKKSENAAIIRSLNEVERHSGIRSLAFRKADGGKSDQVIYVAVPCSNNTIYSGSFYFKALKKFFGKVRIGYGYGTIRNYNNNDKPLLVYQSKIQYYADLIPSETDWLMYSSSNFAFTPPASATHFLLQIDFGNSYGTLLIDDIVINKW